MIDVEVLDLLLQGGGVGPEIRPGRGLRPTGATPGEILDLTHVHRLAQSRPDGLLQLAELRDEFRTPRHGFSRGRGCRRPGLRSGRDGRGRVFSGRFEEALQLADELGVAEGFPEIAVADPPRPRFLLAEGGGRDGDDGDVPQGRVRLNRSAAA